MKKYLLLVALLALAGTLLLWVMGHAAQSGPLAIAGFAFLAVYAMRTKPLKGFAFTFWVLSFVAASMFYPLAFRSWSGFQLSVLIVPLIQIIMFGMGTTLSVRDFGRVLTMPRPVLIGMFLQFTVMPFSGWMIAGAFGFDPQVAAGIILVGSCPAGVASNVMNYLAHADVALSVTMTACSTLASPIMTPTMMSLLAGHYVPIPFWGMVISILKMIILPIAAGLIANKLLRGRAAWLQKALPVVSMASICFIIAIITSLSRDQLLSVGLLLIAAVVMQNMIGYLLGYWGARALGLNETASRTVAIEVGLQNGGMASGLAINVLKSSDAALAPAIFGPWMNTSGSILASLWRGRPVKDDSAPAPSSKLAPSRPS